jgi:L-lactate dehydrogenase complex protein LldG
LVAQPHVSAREEVLARIRTALARSGDAAPAPEGAAYRIDDGRSAAEHADRFAERAAEYRARLHRVEAPNLAEAVARVLAERRVATLVVPADVPAPWLSRLSGIAVNHDRGLSVAAVAKCDAALTGVALAIAETGSVVLDCGPAQGRRLLSLLPDCHVCVVMAHQVVGTVPQAIRRLESAARDGRPITFVSGPSATSDIELDRVEGVHGPRNLEILLVG